MPAETSTTVTRILIVEDDEDDYLLACDFLEEMPFLNPQLERAATVEAAIQKLARQEYHLCLLDYRLGSTNGVEVLIQAKEIGFELPIIMLTGQADPEIDRKALELGAVDFVLKSEVSTERFARSVRYALARSEIEGERRERLRVETEIKAMEKFLAHLSHELRTPLTAILGYTEILLGQPLSTETLDGLEVILRNGRHLLTLVNDVLDYSKISADSVELHPSDVDVNSFLADLDGLVRFQARDKGLDFHIAADTPLPGTITIDPTRFRQILINLVSNAIKFTDSGSVSVHMSMEEDSGTDVLVTKVIDTGIGISPDKQGLIFRPFEQVQHASLLSSGGSGLGLAICNELIGRMGGTLSVSSVPDEGSCFTATFPLEGRSAVRRQSIDISDPAVTRHLEPATPSLGGTVLVVDDLRDVRTLLGHMVSRVGAQVEFAGNGAEALDKLAASTAPDTAIDLVLMDIHMPVMDGRQALGKIREMGLTTPVVAVTAVSATGADHELRQLGFQDIINKPVDSERLEALLARYLPSKAESDDATPTTLSQSVEWQSRARVLLVDDDRDAANALALLLEARQVPTVTANSAEEAMALYESESSWRHVLLDLDLGGASGLDVARKIRAQDDKVAITILSGSEPDENLISKLQISRVLLKPVTSEQLLFLLEHA